MPAKRPSILLSNDDGITAPGLEALHREICSLGDVTVVAPDTEKSAVGHAITISDPLRVWEVTMNKSFSGYAVNGTPADCVKLAIRSILDHKPDLLISGINLGRNTGIDIIYSGTVSAATEGIILEVPAFAISLATFKNPNFKLAAKVAKNLATFVLEHGLPKGTLLNVNVPNVSEDDVAGTMITRQGKSVFKEKFERRIDPFGRVYYWLAGSKEIIDEDADIDDRAILDHKVSITPLHYDMTDYSFLDELRSWEITI